MSNVRVIRLPERSKGQFTGKYSDVTLAEALMRVASQIARCPVPLPIQNYETAEMILVYADHMSAVDADALAWAFGSFPTLEALRTSIPDIEARMYHPSVLSPSEQV